MSAITCSNLCWSWVRFVVGLASRAATICRGHRQVGGGTALRCPPASPAGTEPQRAPEQGWEGNAPQTLAVPEPRRTAARQHPARPPPGQRGGPLGVDCAGVLCLPAPVWPSQTLLKSARNSWPSQPRRAGASVCAYITCVRGIMQTTLIPFLWGWMQASDRSVTKYCLLLSCLLFPPQVR